MGCVLGFPFEDEKELRTEASSLHPMAVVQHLTQAVPDLEGFVPLGIAFDLGDADCAVGDVPRQVEVAFLVERGQRRESMHSQQVCQLILRCRMGFESPLHNVRIGVVLAVPPQRVGKTTRPVRAPASPPSAALARAGASGTLGFRAGAGRLERRPKKPSVSMIWMWWPALCISAVCFSLLPKFPYFQWGLQPRTRTLVVELLTQSFTRLAPIFRAISVSSASL